MTPSTSATSNLNRLLEIACEEQEQLTSGDIEAALALRITYDEAFATMQAAVARGSVVFDDTHRLQLARLQQLHLENLAQYETLRDDVTRDLQALAKVTRIGSYAPLGPRGKRGPSHFDRSA